MTTTTSIHSGTTPPAQTAPPEFEDTARGFQAHHRGTTRYGVLPVEGVGGASSRGGRDRERPEDDEAVITAVLPALTHRSFRERPEDDEVIPTYTSVPVCPQAG